MSANRLHVARPWSARQMARCALLAVVPRRYLFDRLPGRNAIYLTFDDGPHPEHTPDVLDALQQHGAKATFFVVGRNCEAHPELVRRIVAEGHALGNHTYSHVDPDSTTVDEYMREVQQTASCIRAITGVSTRLFRPPHGMLCAATFTRLLRANQTTVLWTIDPKDFRSVELSEITHWLEQTRLRSGDVVLLHDDRRHAASVVGSIADARSHTALRLQSLADCLPNVHVP